MKYWSALDILKQVTGELGLIQPNALPTTDVQINQFQFLLNTAGNELLLLYPWEHLRKTWTLTTVNGQDTYNLPEDWAYFLDQTQWDTTNRWPLLGPKTAQEWAWLKGTNIAAAPRMRFRVYGNKFVLHPVPESPITLTMEYVQCNWVKPDEDHWADRTVAGGDTVMYNPWLVNKFTKLKFYELKGFETAHVRTDFTRTFNSVTGKDVGAPVLSLSSRPVPYLLGPHSVQDGSWSV